nr:integrase, catalytic region, zinc finger, CCHC-type, peptidase aspartic, catalytic [Tanacetum cinerariifolium]
MMSLFKSDSKYSDMFSQFESGGASGSGGVRTTRKVPTIRTMRMRMAMAILSCVIYGFEEFPRRPGNMCHRGTDLLTGKYVRPTVLLGIVAGEGISCDRSPATSRRGKASQQQVAGESRELSLGKRLNVVVFTKLINDMRNIKMTMPRMQLNSKFVNNMLPEWGRFVTVVKLNRGLKKSNYDQLYAYLKQHEENGVVLDIEQLLFIADGQDNAVNEDIDEPSVQDLALNVDNVFQADECDPVYDEASLSYDSDILYEVHEHDNYQDAVYKLHEVHEMHGNVQLNYVVDLDADYTSDSNMILYDQHVKDNVEPVVQNNVSSVPNDASMMIINEMHE